MKLNTDNIRLRQKSGNSLTDLNHIDLFTDGFLQSKEGLAEQKIKWEAGVQEKIFLGEQQEAQNSRTLPELLFLQKAETGTEAAAETGQNESGFAGILLGTVLVAGVFSIVFLKKKRKRGEQLA